jgi:hypothetical protein
MDTELETSETGQESVDPSGQESIPDYAQGFEITICAYPDGFTVKGPSPLPQTPSGEEEVRIPDLATALKHVIAISKDHPLDGDMGSQFQAGYDGE